MIGEPARTNYDWNFRLFQLPVRVHPLFWVIGVFFSPFYDSIGNMRIWLFAMLAWLAAWFLAILVHECGHALVIQRLFGAKPWIVLYGLGGVTAHQPYYRRPPSPMGRVLISFAGPAAGFIVSGLILLAFWLCGDEIIFGMQSIGPIPIPVILPESILSGMDPDGGILAMAGGVFVFAFIWMSLFWGALNLLPIDPLDGGNISHVLLHKMDPVGGHRAAVWISALLAAFLALVLLREGSFFGGLLFGFLAIESFRKL